jgi:D-3-phosphoglycerate dehydrogenase / 2-oxoglutarate reductase
LQNRTVPLVACSRTLHTSQMKPKILFGPAPMRDIPDCYEPELLAAGYELVYPPVARQMTETELHSLLPGCIASLAGSEPYTRRVIETAAQAGLKVIARAGVGYDAVDVSAATENGVIVTYAPGSNHEAVGEHALLLILALAKNLLMQDRETKAGRWPRKAQHPVRDKTLGIIGLGRTGTATAMRALAFRMNVIASDPYIDAAKATALGVQLVSQQELLERADFVSLHIPLTPETRNLIRAETLQKMKPTAMLVNTARGEVVHEEDLHAALQSKRIAAAALDVFEHEPLKDHPFQALDNVILTAHTAGVDFRSREQMVNFAARGIVECLAGRWPAEWIVNPEVRAG